MADTNDSTDDSSSGAGTDDSGDSDSPAGRHFVDVAASADSGSDPQPDTGDAAFPVASTGGDGSNSLPAGLSTLNLWLLDVAGQRMGANANSDDDFEQQNGAPFRITTSGGQVFAGYADANGMVTLSNVMAAGPATVEWGLLDPTTAVHLPWGLEEDPFPEFFAYCEQINFDVGASDDLEASRKLSNLGYIGEIDDQRAAFAQDYSASDNDTIESVHSGGTAATPSASDASQSGAGDSQNDPSSTGGT